MDLSFFGWGGGMGVRAVSRRDCIALGVVTDNAVLATVQELKNEQHAAPGMNSPPDSKAAAR